jgi:hypothetical protein
MPFDKWRIRKFAVPFGRLTLPVKVVMYATSKYGYMEVLEKQLEKGGVPYDVVGMGEKHSWKARLLHYLHYAQTHQREKLFFVDAWDMLFCGDADELEEKFDLSDDYDTLTFSAEKNCWPTEEFKRSFCSNSPWKYLNAGGLCCWAGALSEFMESRNMDFVADSVDDQWLWHRMHYYWPRAEGIELDVFCEIFQSLYMLDENDLEFENGRFTNKRFNTKPLFLHGNGKVDMGQLVELLDNT